MNIAIYARISTSDGRQSADNQLAVLREWALRVAGPGMLEVTQYVDEMSGSVSKRPQFQAMLEGARKRKFDVLLVWALDRLTREGIAKTMGYLATLRQCGVRVLSNQEAWLDTEGPMSDLLVAIFGWAASFERSRLSERVKSGLERAKAKGTKLGRPTLKTDLDAIRLMRADGKTLRQIATATGVSKTFVAKHLEAL